jgi:membrane protease YdiL (CAAX protease family)
MRISLQHNRTEQLVELAVFLFLIVPSMVLSFFAVKQGSLGFALVAVATIFRDLALVSLILFFLWRNGEPVAQIGWTFEHGRNEFLLGVALFVPFTYCAGLLERSLLAAGFSVPSTPLPALTPVRDTTELALAVALVVIVAVAEETIFRGYLILRLQAITASPAAAVVLSAAVFSLGHGYEGSAGVVTVGVMGVVFALIYLWRRSVIAPVVMHFLQDFIGIVMLPLLGATR